MVLTMGQERLNVDLSIERIVKHLRDVKSLTKSVLLTDDQKF